MNHGFGADQTDAAIGAAAHGRADLIRRAGVGRAEDRERRTVPRAAGPGGQRVRPRTAAHQLDLSAAGFGGLFGGGVHRQHGAFAVQHGAVAVGGGRHAFAHAAERGHPHAARHDGRVAGDAVFFRDKAEDHAAVQRKQVAGVEQIGRQDAGLLELQGQVGPPVQNIDHPAAGVADVDAALRR